MSCFFFVFAHFCSLEECQRLLSIALRFHYLQALSRPVGQFLSKLRCVDPIFAFVLCVRSLESCVIEDDKMQSGIDTMSSDALNDTDVSKVVQTYVGHC